MWRFFHTTGSIFRFLGHFHSDLSDVFNLKSRFSALAPRPIYHYISPYIFIYKLLVKKWKTEGKSIVVYLDDSLGSAANYVEAKITSLAVHADLLKSGFLPNEEKSIWDLAQDIICLGTVINTSECLISATDSGIYQSLTEDLLFLLGSKDSLFQVRKLASVCGKKIFRLGTAPWT